MKPKDIFGLLRETFSDWSEDKASRLSASLAYFTMFSIAPLLVIVIAIAGLVFGKDAAQGALVTQIQGLVGQQGAEMIQTMIQNTSKPSTSIIATIIGLITLLLGASGVFGALQDALNTIWGVAPKPRAGLMGMVRQRFVSFTMILGIGFLLLVSLVLSAALAAVGKFVGGLFPGAEILAQVINFVISFVVITGLFAMIYKVLPDVKIAWSDVWIGAAVTALLFTIGRLLIGLYLGRGAVGSAYGAAGSLVVVLTWIYYSAMLLFMGAEFTKVYAYKFGSHIEPAEDAVPVTPEAQAEQGIPRRETVERAARGEPVGKSGAERQPGQVTERGQTGRQGQSERTPGAGQASGGRGRQGTRSVAPINAQIAAFHEQPRKARPWAVAIMGAVFAFAAFGARKPGPGGRAGQ